MKKIALTVNGMRFKTKEMDDTFVDFIEQSLHSSGIELHEDNSVEKLFIAYLKLAGKYHKSEKEIEEMIIDIDN